jgi:isopentenyl diphosphate isomerase/L-lactate dehydrogenase-like FMN-dependent dehydrogenase
MSRVPEINEDLWRRVREAGFTAMMLTTDTQLLGKRESDVKHSFELPSHLKLANWSKYSVVSEIKANENESGLSAFVKQNKDQEIGWDIIPYIKKMSGLKVFAKGIMC